MNLVGRKRDWLSSSSGKLCIFVTMFGSDRGPNELLCHKFYCSVSSRG